MQFRAEHDFAAPPAAVLGAMVDPELYLGLELPGVSRPELLGRAVEGERDEIVTLSLRYRYLGRLDPIARRIVGNDELSWVQELRADLGEPAARLTYASEDAARRLRGEARVSFTSAASNGAPHGLVSAGDPTTRVIEGALVVAIRLVGATAERSLVAGLLGRLDLEAAALRASLASP